MGTLIDGIRQVYEQTLRPVIDDITEAAAPIVEHVTEAAAPVVEAAETVGGAIVDGAQDVSARVQQDGVLNVAGKLVSQHASTTVDVLGELTRRSPVDFVNWLAGPEGPKVSDYTAQVPGLQEAFGGVIDASMQNPMVAGAIGQAFGFEYVAAGDYYTTNEGSMQSYLGFHDAYDKVGKLLGMDLDEQVMRFEANGVEYRLELWKGSYGSGGAYGGEIGLYTNGSGDRGPLGDLLEHIPGYYSAATGDNQIQMTQTISAPEHGSFTNAHAGADGADGEHYWNLAIRTDPNVNHEDITQTGTLVFGDGEVAQAAFSEMQQQLGAENVSLSADGLTINYTWQ